MEILKYLYLLIFAATVLGSLWEDLKKRRSWWLTIPTVLADVGVFGLALGKPMVGWIPQWLSFGIIGFGVAVNAAAFPRDIRELNEEKGEGAEPWKVGCSIGLAVAILIPAFVMATMNVLSRGA
jgi:hypothetical protein